MNEAEQTETESTAPAEGTTTAEPAERDAVTLDADGRGGAS